jgi:hypothetical protein
MLDTGYERGRHGAEADKEHAETPGGGRDGVWPGSDEILWFQDDSFLAGERHQRLLPLRWDPARVGPMLDGALALAEEVGQPALVAKAANDSFG